jgi:enamine deaminase RidA (YjgF/YER057c/UK114 family)
MPTAASARLKELGLTLPTPAPPVGSYVPCKVIAGPYGPVLLYTSGMVPVINGGPIQTGKLGADVSLDAAQECARLCVLNALAWVKEYAGKQFTGILNARRSGIDKVREVVQVRGFVACTPEFADHPKVINAASDLLVDIFGDAGRHTRSSVGCISLPLNVPVEIDFLFAL